MTIAIAAVAAALLAAVGPFVIGRLPEPPDPDDDKIAYAELARARHLAWWFAGAAAVMAGVAAWQVPPELAPVWVLFAGVGTWLAYVDWRTRLLPFLFVAPTYVATLALVALGAFLLDDWSRPGHGPHRQRRGVRRVLARLPGRSAASAGERSATATCGSPPSSAWPSARSAPRRR